MARQKDETRRRKTIMIDMNNKYKLQMLQSKLIEISENTISFSRAVESMLERALQLPDKPEASIRSEFPADRVTIMISAKIDAKIKMRLAYVIRQCAKDECDLPASSYSRIINSILNQGFDAGLDRKIITDARK